MPDFLVTDPAGRRYKVSMPDDPLSSGQRPTPLTSNQSELIAAQQAEGRFAPLAKAAGDYFTPFSTMRNPDTPETRQAYDEALQRAHAAGGGKVPAAPGSPRFSPEIGMGLDIAANVGGKAAGALKGLSAVRGASAGGRAIFDETLGLGPGSLALR